VCQKLLWTPKSRTGAEDAGYAFLLPPKMRLTGSWKRVCFRPEPSSILKLYTMKKGTFILLCWLWPTIVSITAVQAEDFKLVGREKQVSLFERWIPSSKGMTVRELKAVFVVHSDIPAIVELLQDERRSARWNVNADDSRILKTGAKDQWISYARYDIPWPLDDQDCCLAYQLAGDFNRTVISFRSISSRYFPVSTDVERITGVRGKWILQKEKDNNIKVVYLITTDRSKKVPRWLSDKIIHSNLYNTMAAFKAMAEQAS
jgi:hypothetical protein